MASLNGKKVKGQARTRILSMNVMRRLSKSQWRGGSAQHFSHICIFFLFAVLFNKIANDSLNVELKHFQAIAQPTVIYMAEIVPE